MNKYQSQNFMNLGYQIADISVDNRKGVNFNTVPYEGDPLENLNFEKRFYAK